MFTETRENRLIRASEIIKQKVPDVCMIVHYGSGARKDRRPKDIDILVVLEEGDIASRIHRLSILGEPSQNALRIAKIPVGHKRLQVHVEEIPISAYQTPHPDQEYLIAAKKEGKIIWQKE